LLLALLAASGFAGAPARAGAAPAPVALRLLGSYVSGLGEGAAETVAYDRGRIFVTNAASNTLDLVDVTNPAAPRLVRRLDLAPFGAGPNSVAVHDGLVAVAVEAAPKTSPGAVVVFDRDGDRIDTVRVGALPDMLTFTPDGRHLLVANEGEPNSYNQPDSVDPEGTVSIIDVRPLLAAARSRPDRPERPDRPDRPERPDRPGTATATAGPAPSPTASATAAATAGPTATAVSAGRPDLVRTVDFRDFNAGGRRRAELSPEIRVFGPNATVAQDFEPEYIAVSADSRTAYVTLQENNAIAVVGIDSGRVERLLPLGVKDHNLAGAGLDASDQDGQIAVRPWPVKGLFLPDALAAFQVEGATYLATANEGDARDYPGFTEEARTGSLLLDPAAFPTAAELQQSRNLGRLNVTRTLGQGPNGYTGLFAFGARSFTIWRADTGERVWDSGDQLERITAQAAPGAFNASNTNNTFDNRSDDKGPEPEAVAVGTVDGRTYAFVGLERIGGVAVFDVSDPRAPGFVQYANNRDFARTPPGPDSGAEIVRFVPAGASTTGRPLVLVSNEISGTVSLYEIGPAGG
jgi:DNA-binding beta-propeller fold protein YncE